MRPRAAVLRNSLVLRGLDPDLLSGLAALARSVTLDAGEVLFHAGDPPDGFYSLVDGSLKVSVTSSEGQERLLAILGPGDIVGEMGAIDGQPRSASVTALKPCSLAFVRTADFERFGAEHPGIYRSMLVSMSARLRQANEAGSAETFLPIDGRLARCFVRLAESFGEELPDGTVAIRFKISQTDVGNMCGAARENVCRTLGAWRKAGLISMAGAHYRLQNFEELKRRADLERAVALPKLTARSRRPPG